MTTLTCAIQLGSNRIMAIAAKKDTKTGTNSNIQIESESARDCISHGCIVSVEQTAMHIRSLIQKLSNRMHTTISAAYVGVGGMSLHSLVQQPTVQIPDYDVLDSDPLSNGQYQLIVGQKRIRQRIQAAMDRANVRLINLIVLPKATARILTADERQRGCVLVDMGAGTTTVSVYQGGDLRHLAVLPMGGENVTYDIQSAGCSFDDAERIKLEWSNVAQEIQPEPSAADTSAHFADKALPMPQSKLNNIALCRYEEIADNIAHQIELSGLKGKLEAGCILTGGAAVQQGLTALLGRRLSISRIETRAYRDIAMLSSERKPHLTNALALLTFCTESCETSTSAQPTVVPTSTIVRPSVAPSAVPANDGQLDLGLPDQEPEEEAPHSSNTFGQSAKRFIRDLFTGQDDTPKHSRHK